MTVQFKDIYLKQLDESFVALFDGKTLDGWHLMNGANFVVEDGVVKTLNVEEAPPNHDISSAATMLTQLG